MQAWVILHGNTEFGDLFWAGYNRTLKDHKFVRDKKYAVKFLTEWDARKAGVGLTQGASFREETFDELPEGTIDASP